MGAGNFNTIAPLLRNSVYFQILMMSSGDHIVPVIITNIDFVIITLPLMSTFLVTGIAISFGNNERRLLAYTARAFNVGARLWSHSSDSIW